MLLLVFKNGNKFVKLPKIVSEFRRYKKYISLYKERVKTNDSTKKINNTVKNDKNPVNNLEITEKFSFLQNTSNILPTGIDNIYNIFNILCNTEPTNTSSDTLDNPQANQKNGIIYINIYLNLNINNISIRGNLILPNPNNYRRKIFVMCDRDEEEYALQCGATYTSESYLDKVVNNSSELEDLIIISNNLHLPKLLKYSKILGPKKLLPNKHMGTLCNNIYEGIKRVRSNNFLQYYIETIKQSEFNQMLSSNSHIDSSELNQKNMCKIRVPISIIENGLKELVDNIKFFIEYLKINNLSNRKVQVNTNTLGNFVYPPPRNLSLSPSDETNDSRENIISHMALDLKNYNHLFFLNHHSLNSLI
ncbi:ribosomal protein L1, putative [Theileria annulata]|uniref:Ribosomal protein L1, putative n=1 Tax=Theileria annulata TaxID=5874 RepID=Q4UHI6_THEAN|nr:ribosomal protein L1, putative [Theileria annulata]CAI73453.1 ribosomal protein L1, putative [Theileria annulata]|eukprot:XP_954130.1 ribosomal protein L1, putative [Theileria annulata]